MRVSLGGGGRGAPKPHLVAIGSAAWFGPHLPSRPRPLIPVLPAGFLFITRVVIYALSVRALPWDSPYNGVFPIVASPVYFAVQGVEMKGPVVKV